MGELQYGRLADLIRKHEADLLNDWIKEQLAALTLRPDLLSESELREQSRALLSALRTALGKGGGEIGGAEWAPVRELLGDVSRSRARQGFTPSETATFVFSLKQPMFTRLRRELGRDADGLADELWTATVLLDKLGLYTTEVFQKSRDELIGRASCRERV